MGITNFDNIGKEVAEGRGRQAATTRATLRGDETGNPLFQRFVILDVIFDPQIIDQIKLEYWEHTIGVTNIKYAVSAPRNAIIARRVQNNTASPVEQPMVLYPFFPPSLSLPCKPGEHVWVMFEDPSGTQRDLGYWMSRIVTAGFVEDVNHTHAHRAHDPGFSPGIKDQFDGKDQAQYEFRNGSVAQQDGERYTVPQTATLPGGDDSYHVLINESDGGKISHYEAVPRYRKRPDETVLEGNNNALIVLGRDRVGAVASYAPDDERGQVPKIPTSDSIEDGAGKIDLVVGRGQTSATGGNKVDNSLGRKELGKTTKDLVQREGDPDFSTDRSRVLIAQKTPVDTNFELTSFNKEFSAGSLQGTASTKVDITDDGNHDDGAIVIKADRLRFIARSDVEILVTTYERDQDGNMVTVEDTDKWAAFVIKTNGDIIFRPAVQGFIKLGGDDADKGILCTDMPVTVANGAISGPPLLTTMGGLIGGSKPAGVAENMGALAAGQGKLSAKVLIK
jgi:hypothetical protein